MLLLADEPETINMDLSDNQLEDQSVIYKHEQLFSESFPLFKEIRRLGKLCDVTLKVGCLSPYLCIITI